MVNTPAQSLNVGSFMTEEPCTVDAGLSIADAQQRMVQNKIRHLLVVNGDRLVGVVSSRDLAVANSLSKTDANKTTVEAAMRPSVYVCDVNTPLSAVAYDMEAHRYGCAIVLDEGRAVGIFTTTDALRALRQVITGAPAEPVAPSQHKRSDSSPDLLREHRVRLGQELFRAHINPSAHQGMIR
jgi:acetoin utilization protein AcuB